MSRGPNNLHINHANRCCLGVCAGIADWLDVPAALVRVIFVICVISWPPLIVGYFLLYFCLDKDITPERMRDYFANAKTAEHFRQLDYRKPIYRNERNKRIAGVCSGLADYLEISPFVVRLLTLLSFFVFGPYTILAYIVCMFVFEPDPDAPVSSRHARRRQRKQRRAERRMHRHNRRRNSYPNGNAGREPANGDSVEAPDESAAEDSFVYSRQECAEIYNTLEMRLREIEAFMTSKRFRLHCEINRI